MRKYQIQGFPKVVFTTAGGEKIVGTGAYYRNEAAKNFLAVMQRAISSVGPIVPLAAAEQAKTMANAMNTAWERKDYAGALKRARLILAVKYELREKAQAEDMLSKLNETAGVAVGEAKQMEKKQEFAEAAKAYRAVMKNFQDTDSAKEATRALSALKRNPELRKKLRKLEVKELWEDAQKFEQAKKYREAKRLYQKLSKDYDDFPEGEAAGKRIVALDNDPKVKAILSGKDVDKECRRFLSMGRSWSANGRKDKARECFQKILQINPGSTYAAEAKKALDALK
ncbi:MAG: hypothetical protein QF437_29740, partial [Planctomycetota bacterium]|jgi:tetratricopeptide (TPR) repeat protein|nr:hypothetical protein [Planctomycetota bacterium]MDP7134715.1 hypothetical protein [Planctomycetota bacterium]MDP7253108.1 hypothetical protein [Planctomycetota bacterium]